MNPPDFHDPAILLGAIRESLEKRDRSADPIIQFITENWKRIRPGLQRSIMIEVSTYLKTHCQEEPESTRGALLAWQQVLDLPILELYI